MRTTVLVLTYHVDGKMSTQFKLHSTLTAYVSKYIVMYHFVGVSGANLGKRFVTDTTGKGTLASMTAHVLKQSISLHKSLTAHTANMRPSIVRNVNQQMRLEMTRKTILFVAFVTFVPLLRRVVSVSNMAFQ